jgi:hypothetical protein
MRGAFILLLCVALVAQEPRFGAQSRLVRMPVSVKDRSGPPIDGLEAAGFAVLDVGRPRRFSLDLFGAGVAVCSRNPVMSKNSIVLKTQVIRLPGRIALRRR